MRPICARKPLTGSGIGTSVDADCSCVVDFGQRNGIRNCREAHTRQRTDPPQGFFEERSLLLRVAISRQRKVYVASEYLSRLKTRIQANDIEKAAQQKACADQHHY